MQNFYARPLNSGARWLAVAALVVAGAAHLPVIGEHLEEAPYMGVLFIVLTAACFALAAAMISFDPPVVYALAVLTCGLAIVGYAATRTVAFPQLADDVGNWFEPLGVVSVLSEALAVAVAGRVVTGRPVVRERRPHPVAIASR